MAASYLLFYLCGLLIANGIPHFVKGLMGEKHVTPFKKPSSAMANVLWGAMNIFVSFWFGVWASSDPIPLLGSSLSILSGVLTAGFTLTTWWENDPKARGK